MKNVAGILEVTRAHFHIENQNCRIPQTQVMVHIQTCRMMVHTFEKGSLEIAVAWGRQARHQVGGYLVDNSEMVSKIVLRNGG